MADSYEDNMTGGGTVRSDDLAVTNQRVTTLERGIRDLQDDQTRMGKDLAQQINNVATGLSSKLEGVVSQINERSKIQWPALSLLLGVLISLGGLVYWPIKDNQQRFEQHLLNIAEKSVTQKDLDQRLITAAQRRDDWQRASEDRQQANSLGIEKLRESVVPRWMHDEKWRLADVKTGEMQRDLDSLRNAFVDRRELDERFKGLTERSQDLQRQIDKQDKMFGDTYNLRDVVTRLLRKQDELEQEVRKRDGAQR